MPEFSTLSDWLSWQEALHPKEIDLGLERVYAVAQSLDLLHPPENADYPYSGRLKITGTQVFTVAGTNGKGSCVATIEQCLLAQGYRVGSYTSPHLHHYCERICIDGQPVSEDQVCQAFAAIDQARGDISLSYFEFGTLAALWLFVQAQMPFVLLEVGLGGRLDAVNIVDADVAVITSIGIDHEDWLGRDREQIALEKLGVTRPSQTVVVTETSPTHSLKEFVFGHTSTTTNGVVRVQLIDQHFTVESTESNEFKWRPAKQHDLKQLPLPDLSLTSVIGGLQALFLRDLLPDDDTLLTILSRLQLKGRYQKLTFRGRQLVFDVAHNPAASEKLADSLQYEGHFQGKTYGVFGIMVDKDIAGILQPLSHIVDYWYGGEIPDQPRSAKISQLKRALGDNKQADLSKSVITAFNRALTESKEHDRIAIFGSFLTVAAIQQSIDYV